MNANDHSGNPPGGNAAHGTVMELAPPVHPIELPPINWQRLLNLPIVSPGGCGNVIKAMVGVMNRVKEVRKEGWNKEGKYAFLYFGDVLASLQDAFVAEGLFVSQREVERKIIQKILAIKYEFDVWHGDQYILNIASHTGACRFEFKSGSTDDKSFSKCLVSAEKYGLLAMFKIPPDDHNTERTSDGDPDAQGLNDREPSSDDGRRRQSGDNRDDRRQDDRPRDDRPRDDPPRARDNRDPDLRNEPPIDRRPPEDGGPDLRREERPSDSQSNVGGPPDDRWGGPPTEDPVPGGSPGAFRERCMTLRRILDGAKTEDDAARIWLDHDDLIRQMPDATFDFFDANYFARWGIHPPTKS